MALIFSVTVMDTASPSKRRCFTASERLRRWDEYSIIPVTEEAPQIEEGEEDMSRKS